MVVKAGKRGPLSREDVLKEAMDAVQNLHDLDFLDGCRLAKHEVVRAMAALRSNDAMPEAQALRSLIIISVNRAYRALQEVPGNEQALEFLEQWVTGLPVTKIARAMGVHRDIIYKRVRPKVFSLIAKTLRLILETLENSCGIVKNPEKLHNGAHCEGCLATTCLVSQKEHLSLIRWSDADSGGR